MAKLLLRLIVLLLLISPLSGRAQQLDPTFGPVETWQSAAVYGTEAQPDGKLLVAGTFTRFNGRAGGGLVRLNADGTLDEAFTTAAAAGSNTTKVRRFPNGQLVVTGYENLRLGGRTFNGVAKLNADGTLVAGFDPGTGPSSLVLTVAVQPDNKTLLGGRFSSFNGTTVGGLVRLNADGSVDQDFAASLGSGFGVGGTVAAIVVQADGKIVVGGQFTNVSGYSLHSLVRLNANGTVDTSFLPFPNARPNSASQVLALALDPRTGQVLAYTYLLGPSVVRLTTTGQIDPTFTTPIMINAVSIGFPNIDGPFAVDAAGGVLLGGTFTMLNAQPERAYLLRLLPNGQLDPQFVPQSFDEQVRTLRVLADGDVVVGGSFSRYGEFLQASLLKINGMTAQAQTAFRPVPDQPGSVRAVAQQADGKLLLAGRFREINGMPAGNVARLQPDGTLDAGFRLSGTNGRVDKVLTLSDGRILLGGQFTKVSGQNAFFVARLLNDGQPDNTFQSPTSAALPRFAGVTALVPHTNGAVLVAGANLNLAGNGSSLYRLLPNGNLDQAYTQKLGTQLPGLPYVVAPLADGRHYVAGGLTRFGTTTVAGIVRLLADGTRDETFVSGTSPSITIRQLAVQPDNKVLIGGAFYSYNGVVRPNVARLNPDGSVDESFGVSKTGFDPDDRVFDLELQPNGRVLVAGINRAYGALHRLNPDGTLDTSFLGFSLYNGAVDEVLVQGDGRLLTAGSFSEVDGQPRAGLARLTASAVLHVGSSQSAAALEVWPNPVRDQLNLRLDVAARPRVVVLLDVLGREVYRKVATGAQMQVPVGQLVAGVYLLRVEYADGPVTRRVVVE